MITVKTMYEIYLADLNQKIDKIKIEIENYQRKVNGVVNILEKHKENLDAFCSVNYNTILKTTSLEVLKSIKFPDYPIYSNGREVNKESLKLYINTYVENNNKFNSLKNQLKKCDNEYIDFKTYKTIITDFNKEIGDKIVNENYMFKLLPSFGAIGVFKKTNKRKRIDWGKSTKNKNAILAKGGIPFIKEDAENDPDYKGEEWIVHRPATDFFLEWHTPSNPFYKSPYRYTPARGVNSIVAKLGEVKKDRAKAIKLYTRDEYI